MESKQSGIGFFGLLTIAFIVLKLIGIISWSWVLVLSPLWISILFICVIMVLVYLRNRRR